MVFIFLANLYFKFIHLFIFIDYLCLCGKEHYGFLNIYLKM